MQIIFDIFSLLFSGAALVISYLAHRAAGKLNANTTQLTLREIELVRRQLADYEKAERAEKTAGVSARMYKFSKGDWRVKVFNSGPATAANVRVEVDENSDFMPESQVQRKFPLSQLEKGHFVEVTSWISSGSSAKERVTLIWDDPSGLDHSKTVELVL